MCTIHVSVGTFEPGTLVVWANRDEALDRPWDPPSLHDGLLAPTDQVAGGTWIGVGSQGLFAGLTNRFSGPPDPTRASRGHLIPRVLQEPDLDAALAVARGFDPAAYNPFHLILATPERAAVVWSDGQALHEHTPPALFAVHERSFGAAPSERQDYLDRTLPLLQNPDDDALLAHLAHHHDPTLDAVCVHWDAHNYGTRSSTLLRMGRTTRYCWTSGRPCVSQWRDDTPLLWELLSS